MYSIFASPNPREELTYLSLKMNQHTSWMHTDAVAGEEAGGSGSGAAGPSGSGQGGSDLRLYLSQIREWVCEFTCDMLFISIRTDAAWYRLARCVPHGLNPFSNLAACRPTVEAVIDYQARTHGLMGVLIGCCHDYLCHCSLTHWRSNQALCWRTPWWASKSCSLPAERKTHCANDSIQTWTLSGVVPSAR